MGEVFKCKMCNGNLGDQIEGNVFTCTYCGTKQTLDNVSLPKLSDKEREEWIKRLDKSHVSIKQVDDLRIQILGAYKELEHLKKYSVKGLLPVYICISVIPIVMAILFIVNDAIEFLTYPLGILGFMVILLGFAHFVKGGRRIPKVESKLNELKMEYIELNKNVDINYIPHEYRYSLAIKYIKHYFKNKSVNSFEEAIHYFEQQGILWMFDQVSEDALENKNAIAIIKEVKQLLRSKS